MTSLQLFLIHHITFILSSMKILFLFLDGIGLGENEPEKNPFARAKMPYPAILARRADSHPRDLRPSKVSVLTCLQWTQTSA